MARTNPDFTQLILSLHNKMLDEIDQFSYRQHIRTRSDALRALLRAGLDALADKDLTTSRMGDQEVAGANVVVDSRTGRIERAFPL